MSAVFQGIFDEMQRQLRAQMNDLADAVATGGARDFPEYKELVGKIHGLAMAERILLDLLEAAEKSD